MPDEKQTPSKEAQSGEEQQPSPPALSLTPSQPEHEQAEASKTTEQPSEKEKKITKRRRARRRLRLTEKRLQVWLPVIISALVFFVTCAGIFYSYQQWLTMEKTLRVSQRAYLVVSSIQADFKMKQIRIELDNVGHVPADEIDVDVRVERHAGQQVLEWKQFRFGTFENQMYPSALKTVVIVPIDGLTPNDVKMIQNGEQSFAVTCYVEYGDGFGNTDRPTFDFRYNPPPNEGWRTLLFYEWKDVKKQYDKSLEDQGLSSPSASPSPTP